MERPTRTTGRFADHTSYEPDEVDSSPSDSSCEQDEEENQAPVSEAAGSTRPRPPSASPPSKRQKTTRDRVTDALQALAVNQKLPAQTRSGPTQTQLAIEDFVAVYEDTTTIADRVRFATHLTPNPATPEVYNVLNKAAKEELVAQFFNSGAE